MTKNAIVVLGLVMLAGCGGSERDAYMELAEERCRDGGVGWTSRDECVAHHDESWSSAAEYGCEQEQYDRLVCYVDHYVGRNGELALEGPCAALAETFLVCLEDAGVVL